MGVVFGGPLFPPAPPVVWAGLAMKWIGWDGSEWMLSDESDGTVMLPGVRGMNMPPVIHHRAAHASVPGARWRGSTVDVREAFWPIQIYTNNGSQDWIEKDRAFWKTMDPTKVGTWVVIQPDGSERRLKLRFIDDGQQSFEHDSARDGWSNYGITLAAEQPFWEGEEVSGSWETGSSAPFFGTAGGPAFTISPGNTLQTAEIVNPGDVPAYMIWRVYGPITAATVGINGRNITLPFTINAGQVVEIDTRPSAQVALKGQADDYGSALDYDWTDKLGTIDFAPLPPGEKSTLTLSMTGTGRITATFVPLYYRAW
jgi:hypothetical protein